MAFDGIVLANVVWDMQQPIPGFILEAAKAV